MQENRRQHQLLLKPVQEDQIPDQVLRTSNDSIEIKATLTKVQHSVLIKKKFDFASLFVSKLNFDEKQQFGNLLCETSDEEFIDEKPNLKEAIFFVEQKSLSKNFTCQTSYRILVYDRLSLFIFSGQNSLRNISVKIVTNQIFENFIVALILASTIAMLLQDPSDNQKQTEYSQTLDKVQNAFGSVLIVECILKIVAMGFVVHENSYLRDTWNWIDFVVVIFAILELMPIDSISLRPLRAFRILRPLKTIKAFPAMRMLIQGIIKSIPSLISALVFMVFILTQFAILGTLLFGGNYFQRCRITETATDEVWPYDLKEERLCSTDPAFGYQCAEGMTCGSPSMIGLPDSSDPIQNMAYIDYGFTNFNNLLTSLVTIFQIMTKEGWTRIMYNIMDTERNWIVCFYFIFLVVIAAFFLLNLIVAILSDSLDNYEQRQIIEEDNQKLKIARSVLRIKDQLKGEELLVFQKALNLIKNSTEMTSFNKLEKSLMKKLNSTNSVSPTENPQTERKQLLITENQKEEFQSSESQIIESGVFDSFQIQEKILPGIATSLAIPYVDQLQKKHVQPDFQINLDDAFKTENLSHDLQEKEFLSFQQNNLAEISNKIDKPEPEPEVEPQDNFLH